MSHKDGTQHFWEAQVGTRDMSQVGDGKFPCLAMPPHNRPSRPAAVRGHMSKHSVRRQGGFGRRLRLTSVFPEKRRQRQ